MHKHLMKISSVEARVITVSALLIILFASCRKQLASEETRYVPQHDTEDFHADNDIAMTIRSLADAIKVGEPLDSTLYDFEGVLTDGQGSPLYTDVQGAPGVWQINVLDNKNVVIRNLYLGDLLPGDLQSYLIQSLRLSDIHPVSYTGMDPVNDEETQIQVYNFGGGYLCFEVRIGIAPNGLEGPLLSIRMTADPPVPDGRQTNG